MCQSERDGAKRSTRNGKGAVCARTSVAIPATSSHMTCPPTRSGYVPMVAEFDYRTGHALTFDRAQATEQRRGGRALRRPLQLGFAAVLAETPFLFTSIRPLNEAPSRRITDGASSVPLTVAVGVSSTRWLAATSPDRLP